MTQVFFGLIVVVAFLSSPGMLLFFGLYSSYSGDAFTQGFFLLAAPGVLVACATAIDARRLRFCQYKFWLAETASAVFLGSLVFLPLTLIGYVRNRIQIARGTAEPRNQEADSKANAFDWLTIPFAFMYLVVCGMAFPSLLQDRTRANEATAVASLRTYGTAQLTYKLQRRAGYITSDGPAYFDNFRNLFSVTNRDGTPLALISPDMANAFAGPAKGTPCAGDCPEQATPYEGYLFLEDPVMAARGDWNEQFALVAYPAKPGKTGRRIYWIGKDGDIRVADAPAKGEPFRLLDEDESPLNATPTLKWEFL